MTVRQARHRQGDRLGRRGLSPIAAVAVLAIVVVGAGAVGFVALSAVSHTTSTSQHSCSPSSSPQCTAKPHTTTEVQSLKEKPVRAGG